MNAEPEFITDDETDMFEQVGKPAAQVVAAAGQSMVARQEQGNSIARQNDAAMVSMIERIVMDPSIPIDRLEQMLAMKERMEDRAREDEERRAKKAYFAAMSRCQTEIPIVVKKQRNTHTNSNYADLAAIEEQAMPVIHRHGFGTMFQPAGYNDKGELQIKWKITHQDGHSESDIAGIPVDGAGSQGRVNKTGTQAFGSTATYGRRYLLCMLFNISTGDDKDGNRVESSDPINEEQAKTIRDLIDEGGVDIAIFCEKWKIDAVPELPISQFEPARKSLVNYAAQLIAERLSGNPAESFTNANMQWGTDMEPDARAAYQFFVNTRVVQVGFIHHPSIAETGASPDGLVGADGLVQIKCPTTKTHIETLQGASIDGGYQKQMQWEMACTGRLWCDFASFDPRMPESMRLHVQRVPRDDATIKSLETEVVDFLNELRLTVHRLRSKYEPDAIVPGELLMMAG